jgi:hypothetical protein
MTISGVCSNIFCYTVQGSAIMAPAALSFAMRSKFLSPNSSEPKVWTYFVIGTLLPTLAIFRWYGYIAKTSKIASFILTGALTVCAKILSDPSTHREPSNKQDQVTPIPTIYLPPAQIVSSSPFSEEISEVEDLAKMLIAGEYTITKEDNGTLTISNPNIQKAFKIWAGKKEGEPLTLDDLNRLNTHLRYQNFSPEKRKKLRKSLYDSLYHLASDDLVEIPFLIGYSGQTITVSKSDGALVFNLSTIYGNPQFMKIEADGTVVFEVYYNNVLVLSFTDENPKPTEKHPNVSEDSNNMYWFKYSDVLSNKIRQDQIGSKKHFLQGGPAHLELIFFKQEEIAAFLQNKNQSLSDVKAFENCYRLLTSFQTSPPTTSFSSSTALTTSDSPEKTTYQIGPMWSPIAASEDSCFVWKITRERNNTVTLELEKQSTGRGVSGGTATRKVILKKGSEKNVLEVEIGKIGSNDTDSYSSTSRYRIEKAESGLKVDPSETNSYTGMHSVFENAPRINSTQSSTEITNEDMDFLIKVLSTVSDIQSSPTTVVVDQKNQTFHTLDGREIPKEHIVSITRYQQGGLGTPYIWYENRESQEAGLCVGSTHGFGNPALGRGH